MTSYWCAAAAAEIVCHVTGHQRWPAQVGSSKSQRAMRASKKVPWWCWAQSYVTVFDQTSCICVSQWAMINFLGRLPSTTSAPGSFTMMSPAMLRSLASTRSRLGTMWGTCLSGDWWFRLAPIPNTAYVLMCFVQFAERERERVCVYGFIGIKSSDWFPGQEQGLRQPAVSTATLCARGTRIIDWLGQLSEHDAVLRRFPIFGA